MTTLERSRWRDGRFACYAPHVLPQGRAFNCDFLRELSGSEFQFVTALAVIHSPSGKMLSTVEISDISFRSLVDHEIQAYLNRHAVLSCAGAFESDGVLRFADRISGTYNFVTALPVSRLIVFLRAQGVEIRTAEPGDISTFETNVIFESKASRGRLPRGSMPT